MSPSNVFYFNGRKVFAGGYAGIVLFSCYLVCLFHQTGTAACSFFLSHQAALLFRQKLSSTHFPLYHKYVSSPGFWYELFQASKKKNFANIFFCFGKFNSLNCHIPSGSEIFWFNSGRIHWLVSQPLSYQAVRMPAVAVAAAADVHFKCDA